MSQIFETPSKKKIKEEKMDTSEEHEETPTFSPASLGLRRVGTAPPPQKTQAPPMQILNARGMPARIRKRNKLFFDDDIINDTRTLRAVSSSPKKASKQNSPLKTPTKVLEKRKGVVSRYMKPDKDEIKEEKISPVSNKYKKAQQILNEQQKIKVETKVKSEIDNAAQETGSIINKDLQKTFVPADRQVGQQIGLRLRNLLKLPKAHKWVSYEWFYSYIDKPLFEGDNDFQICLKETFPKLQTRMLTRTEWSKIRSMMGRVRRCSERFFEEERRELEKKRQKMRLIQNKKTCDVNFYKDLPSEIPLLLPVGTKVQARLRKPQDGIFYGTVDAVDSLTSTYRVTFDRPNLGTHSIPDYEISSDEFNETISIASLMNSRSQRTLNGTLFSPIRSRPSHNRSDPLLGQEIVGGQFRNPVTETETIGGFPIKLLEYLIRIKSTLAIKQTKVQRLRDMNAEAEIRKSRGESYSEDFQQRYASIVISLEKLNSNLYNYLNHVQEYAANLTNNSNLRAMLVPTYLREKCREAADEAVTRNNTNTVHDENMLSLITKLSTILLVASHLNNDDGQPNSQILQVFEGCIEEVKNHLNTENVEVFKKYVQVHLHHIRLGLGQVALNENNNNNINNIENERNASDKLLMNNSDGEMIIGD